MNLLRDTHRDRLRELIREIMESSLPVMCHDASGTPSVAALDALRDELREALETEMALCAQRRNRNGSRLPADVLRAVAAHLPFAARADAARVCAHWRTALVGDARLWRDAVFVWNSYPPPGMERLEPDTSAAAVVKRAGGMRTLAMQMPYEVIADPHVVPLVTSVLAGLRSLTADITPSDEGAWQHILTHPAPRLQTLRVMRYALASVYVLPQSLFGGDAPALRTVLLHCCVTPAPPCAAFSQVTTLGYFRFAKLTGGEVANALLLAPRLTRLVAGSWAYDTSSDVGGWVIPTAFERLCVQKVVGDGVFDALAARARRVVVHEPLPLYADAMVLSAYPLARVAVYWLEAGDRDRDRLSVALTSTRGVEHVIARVNEGFVSAFLRRHLDTMTRTVTHLLLPDSFWLELCALPSPPIWPALTHLTLYLALSGPSVSSSAGPSSSSTTHTLYSHLFVLQDVPLASTCPALETVHLVHTGLRGGARGEYLRVSAERLAGWLAPSVRVLRISGVILSGPGPGVVGLLERVEVEEVGGEDGEGDGEEPYMVQDEEEWEWTFPFEDALQL